MTAAGEAKRRTGTTKGFHRWVAISKAKGRVTWQCNNCEQRIEVQTGYTPAHNTVKRWVNGVAMRRNEGLPACIGKPLELPAEEQGPEGAKVVEVNGAKLFVRPEVTETFERMDAAIGDKSSPDETALAVAEVVRLRAEVRALRAELVAAQRKPPDGKGAGRALSVPDAAPWTVWSWLVGEALRAVGEAGVIYCTGEDAPMVRAWKNGTMPNARQQEAIRNLVATVWGREIFHDYASIEDAREAMEQALHKQHPGRRFDI